MRRLPLACTFLLLSFGMLVSYVGASPVDWPVPASVNPKATSEAVGDLRGIYVYSEHPENTLDAQQLTQALTVAGTDGLALFQGWESIEPSRGAYYWTQLDQWMSTATSSGKKVSLAIRAGLNTPCWLFQSPECGTGYAKLYAGATALKFLVSPREGIGQPQCNSVTIAAPWDPIFLSEWDSLLGAVATHLKSTGAYSALTSIHLTGIDRTTSELRLPAEFLATPCTTNSVEDWLKATPPYSPARLLDAWDKLTSSFQKNFPDKYFGVEVIPTASGDSNLEYPFPAIDDKGCVYQPPWPRGQQSPVCLNTSTVPDQNAPLLALASRKFSGRLSVQYQNLDLRYPASPYVVYAAQTWGTMIGYQTNDYDNFQRAACSGSFVKPGPCDSKTYQALLEVGIYPLGRTSSLRAQYIEVLPPDAIAFPDAIQQAHLELGLSPPATTTGIKQVTGPTTTEAVSPTTSRAGASTSSSVTKPVETAAPNNTILVIVAVLIIAVLAGSGVYVLRRKRQPKT